MLVEIDYKNCDPEALAVILWRNVLTGREDARFKAELKSYYGHLTCQELWDKCEQLCGGRLYVEQGVKLKVKEYVKPAAAPRLPACKPAIIREQARDIIHDIKCELYRRDLASIVLYDEILYIKTYRRTACEKVVRKLGYIGEIAWGKS
jgi:hypothetical protein